MSNTRIFFYLFRNDVKVLLFATDVLLLLYVCLETVGYWVVTGRNISFDEDDTRVHRIKQPTLN